MNKMTNDATKQVGGFLFQFCVALQKCFEMTDGESVYIEKYGDVTIFSDENITQIEIKDYSSSLTDLDHNFWKTLQNWMKNREITSYKNLILLTTQDMSSNTYLNGWNDKSNNEKYNILQLIYDNFISKQNQSSATKELLNYVMDESRKELLLDLLSKFVIINSYEKCDKLYKKLLDTAAYPIAHSEKEDFINALLGYILEPSKVLNQWVIKYDDFQKRAKNIANNMMAKDITFPNIKIDRQKIDNLEYDSHTFIKKIEDIEYYDVKIDAIHDFLYSTKLISDELAKYAFEPSDYEKYQSDIYEVYKAQHRKASRNCDQLRITKDSQDFYDDIMAMNSPNFLNFRDTTISFKNGMVHQMADDDSNKNDKKIVWKLK
ncbi:hypothetical protein [Campylobacter mucosalis]|uniref:hypothetical protein n=1 Tax=Campylobacter mucosalis TaxID=202 RepID=UPI00147032BE|nr:hypothetical protein [Campylobacter mucosalis]